MPKAATPQATELPESMPKRTILGRLLGALKWTGGFIRRRWLLLLILAVLLVPVVGIAVFLLTPEQPEIITETAKRGTLLQTVEAVGTVISEKDLTLKFAVTGVVSEVNVQEGDTVEAGDILAALRSRSALQADVNSASASVQGARADLQELEEGTRPEEIAIAEAELENKRASLELARTTLKNAEASLERAEEKLELVRSEATTNLAGDIASAGSAISQQATKVQSSLTTIDNVFATTIVRNAVEYYSTTKLENLHLLQDAAKDAVNVVVSSSFPREYDAAQESLITARNAFFQASQSAAFAFSLILETPPSSYFSESVKETYKSNITTERNTIETALSTMATELESFRNASEGYRTSISTQEAAVTTAQGTYNKAQTDIATYETLVKTQEAQLALKKAGARQTDIQSAKARLNQAYAELQRANAKLEDVLLRAPIDGRMTKVDMKAGEFSSDRAITMLGDSPFRIELFTSEIDIPKVALSQSGAIELDAYPNRDFWLTVSEIDPAATLVDNVPKYRVKMDFAEEESEELFKIGMTGDVDIITGVRFDVVQVPGRAVIRDEEGEDIVRILKDDGSIEERKVVVGMETDTDAEIMEGVEEGETVVVLIKN